MSDSLLTQTVTVRPQTKDVKTYPQPGFDTSLTNQRWHQAMEQAQAMLWLRAKPSLEPFARTPASIQARPPLSEPSQSADAKTLRAVSTPPSTPLDLKPGQPNLHHHSAATLRPLRVSSTHLHDQRLGAEREGFLVMTPNTSLPSQPLGAIAQGSEGMWPRSSGSQGLAHGVHSGISARNPYTQIIKSGQPMVGHNQRALEPFLIRLTYHRQPDGMHVWLGVHSKLLRQGLNPQQLLDNLRQVFALHPEAWAVSPGGLPQGAAHMHLKKVIVNGRCIFWREDSATAYPRANSYISPGQTNAEPQAFLFDM